VPGRVIPFPPESHVEPSQLLRSIRGRYGLAQSEFAPLLGRAIGRPDLTAGALRAWEDQAVRVPRSVLEAAAAVARKLPIQGATGVLRKGEQEQAAPAEHFAVIVQQLAVLDHERGPKSALGPAVAVYNSVWESAKAARSPDRKGCLRVAARCAELVGWLLQDSGPLRKAREWTDRALDLAESADAGELAPYILMRRSASAADLGRPDDSLLLAERALRGAGNPSDRALAFREVAAARALMGDEPGFRRAIEIALEHADDAGPTAALAPYCTTSYLQSEAGAAALVFGEPRLAVRYLEPAAHDWPHGQQRDLALCLARLSVAYSRDGQLEQAAETALRARRAATTAFSRRFETTLNRALQTLNELDGLGGFEHLRERLPPSLA
jgi:hypothetical protein